MSISTKHPQFIARETQWTKCDDAYEGEDRIKSKRMLYLPPTCGQELDGARTNAKSKGAKAYDAYIERARFPAFVEGAVEKLIGIMHHKPPKIDLPPQLEPLRMMATVDRQPLNLLLREINTQQLITGRLGLLADVPTGRPVGEAIPYIAIYRALNVINWDDGRREDPLLQTLNLVVLDESEEERANENSEFNWKRVTKYRVLVLGDAKENEPTGVYRTGQFRQDEDGGVEFNEELLRTPSIAGRELNEIPFAFVNALDIVAEPDKPPLLAMANLALGAYKVSADYFQALHLLTQDTLVTRGTIMNHPLAMQDNPTVRVGAGASLHMDDNGDAKFIGINSQGVPELRSSRDADRKEAAELGGHLLDTKGAEAESGEALRIRVSARTASLNQIALAGAAGLETVLKSIARWMGADPDAVKVTPNLDFADKPLDGDTLVKIVQSKREGAPISQRSIHEMMREKDLTKMSFEEELAAIGRETPLVDETNEQTAPGESTSPPDAGESGDDE